MKKAFLTALLAVMCLPAYALAQPRITATPCYWLYSIPYIESSEEDGGDPGQRELATNRIAHELRALGLVSIIASEAGGNRAVACMIAGRLQQPKLGQIRDLLHSVGMGTKIPESEAASIMGSATLHTRHLSNRRVIAG
jgi:hypothetical protein